MLQHEIRFTDRELSCRKLTYSIIAFMEEDKGKGKMQNGKTERKAYPKFVLLITIADSMYPINCLCFNNSKSIHWKVQGRSLNPGLFQLHFKINKPCWLEL